MNPNALFETKHVGLKCGNPIHKNTEVHAQHQRCWVCAQHEFELPHLSPYFFDVGLGLGNPSPKGVFMFIFKGFGFILFGSISSSSSLYGINSQKLVKILGYHGEFVESIHIRRWVKTLGNKSESPCVWVCTMFEEICKYIDTYKNS